jgi:UDP-N-acetylmuramate dehydrogenase
MTGKDIIEALQAVGKAARVRYGEPMSRHTSLGIGGPAEAFVAPEDTETLLSVLEAAKGCGAPVLPLGGGTNLLVRDSGIGGLVVYVSGFAGIEMLEERASAVRLRAGSGVRLQSLLAYCRREGLSGIEALAGIPGMLGGALVGNAGSFDSEIKDVSEEIEVVGLDGVKGMVKASGAGFCYRGSGLAGKGIVTGAVLRLERTDPAEVDERAEGFFKRKQASQPIGERSAGCVFKNPEGDSAGRLIDDAGCKGMQEGAIEVSRLHANFFINRGGGSAESFLRLMEKVASRVRESSGLALEPEIKVVGA